MNDFGRTQYECEAPIHGAHAAANAPAGVGAKHDPATLRSISLTRDLERAEALLNVMFEAKGLGDEQFRALAEMAWTLTRTSAFAVMELRSSLPRAQFLEANLCRADNLLSAITAAEGVDGEALRGLTDMAWALVQECYFIMSGRGSDETDLPSYFLRTKEALS